jgi:hypothetical protein
MPHIVPKIVQSAPVLRYVCGRDGEEEVEVVS